MPTITINGQQLTVEAGTTVIQAAEKAGIYVPRYCYHPGLSIAGSCRMCLVEIENTPKLQIACYTTVTDGMKVSTETDQVKTARRGMLEFLLSNHPLDCPVCDQSGECDLQNFYMEHGKYESRFLEDKVKKKKATPIGPHVMLDQERCILCTRCTRFTEEVSRSNELGVFNRGNRSVIDLYPGKSLDNPYSGNVIDICPVGALTEREFRFQCRVWYLSTEDSICPGCSRGCNISIHHNASRLHKAGGKRVLRLKPRFNPEVNKWWMCDIGRFGFRPIDEDRIEFPHVRRPKGQEATDWDVALNRAGEVLRETLDREGPRAAGLIASPRMSNEELLAARSLFVEKLKISNVALDNPWEDKGPEDDFLLKSDRNPNRKGATEIGFAGDSRTLLKSASEGEIKALIIFHHDFSGEAEELLRKTRHVIFVGTNWNSTARVADIVLAGATHAEKEGTFTNFEGRIQRFKPAFAPLEESRPAVEILSDLAHSLGVPAANREPEAIFKEWQGTGYDEIGEFGMMVGSAAVMES